MIALTLANFIETRNALRFCPSCGWNVTPHPENRAVLTCPQHEKIYVITQTPKGYRVEVILSEDAD
jgi:NADH pyrophosphatase NudC (nudix superfamily)